MPGHGGDRAPLGLVQLDGLAVRAVRHDFGCPRLRAAGVRLGQRLRGGRQPGQALGYGLLGERVPSQGEQHRGLPGSGFRLGPVERQHASLIDRRGHRRGRVVDAEPGHRAQDHIGRDRGVPVARSPGQQVADERAAAPRILRVSPAGEQLAGEPVGLAGLDLRQ